MAANTVSYYENFNDHGRVLKLRRLFYADFQNGGVNHVQDHKRRGDRGHDRGPNYIKQAENGCFVLCPEAEATGIAHNGTVYHLLGRPDMAGAEITVMLEETDAGAEIQAASVSATGKRQTIRATVSGGQNVCAGGHGRAGRNGAGNAGSVQDLGGDFRSRKDCPERYDYKRRRNPLPCRAIGGRSAMEHQPPHGEGMLAVYRPIDKAHTGTQEDPIPWVYGMDCTAGLYYSYNGVVYLCKADMKPCVWAPGTAGLWQWEAVT